jgi:GTP cyclohydrolase I
MGRRRSAARRPDRYTARVVHSCGEFFAGYAVDPRELLARTFSEVEGYDEMI